MHISVTWKERGSYTWIQIQKTKCPLKMTVTTCHIRSTPLTLRTAQMMRSLIVAHSTGCTRMSAHILNIFVEKINRARRDRFSPRDSGTVKVLRTILVLSSTHDCAHASVSVTAVFHSGVALRMALDQQKTACMW
jgi:hypothetical protein